MARRFSSELRGAAIFNGKARCVDCHPAPYCPDNSMHNLKAERFNPLEMAHGRMMAHDGRVKRFPLRGIKDSSHYLHDELFLTP